MEDNLITFSSSGLVTLTGVTESDPRVIKSIQTYLSYQELTHAEPDLSKYNIRVYPNPVNDVINIEAPGSWQLLLFNSTGLQILSYAGEIGTKTVTLDHLPPGIYFARLNSGTRIQTMRLLKL